MFSFSHLQIYLLFKLLCLFLLFSAIGFLTRISSAVSFILGLFLYSYFLVNFGPVFNSKALFLVVSFVLIFSNMGDRLSVDALLKSNNRKQSFQLFWNVWTIRLISLLIFLFYFTSGLQKIRLSGLDWVLSDHLAISLLDQGLPLGVFLSQFLILSHCQAFAGLSVQLLSFIPILFSRTIPLFVVLTSLFCLFLHITIEPYYGFHFSVLIFLVPWGDCFSKIPGNFKDIAFLQCFFKTTPRLNLKNKIILVILFIVSAFVIIMAVLTPYTQNQHFYPFSKTAMFSHTDTIPIKRRKIFIVDQDNTKRLLSEKELSKSIQTGLFYILKSIKKQKNRGGVEEQLIHNILIKIKNNQAPFDQLNEFPSFKFVKQISFENCFWATSKKYLSNPKKHDYCEVILQKTF